jgi:hypothetical protein
MVPCHHARLRPPGGRGDKASGRDERCQAMVCVCRESGEDAGA